MRLEVKLLLWWAERFGRKRSGENQKAEENLVKGAKGFYDRSKRRKKMYINKMVEVIKEAITVCFKRVFQWRKARVYSQCEIDYIY